MVDISKVDIDRIENLQKELKLYLPLIGGIISGNLSVDGKFQLNNLNNLNKTANKIAVFNDSGEIDFRTASEIKDDINAGTVDNITITQDNSDKMQVIGTLEKNKQSAKYDWIGTLAEYNAQNIEKTHPTWVCFITDDFTGSGEADKGNYTKDEIDVKLNLKADKTELSPLATKEEVNNLLNNKADKNTTNNLLNNKADKDLNNIVPNQNFINNSTNWMMPNYSAGIELSANTSAPNNGYIYVKMGRVSESYANIKIDDIVVFHTGGSFNNETYPLLPISKGSKCNYNCTFFPLKGVK